MAAPEPEPLLTQSAIVRKLREELFGGKFSPNTFAAMVARGLPSVTIPGLKHPRFLYSKAVAWIQNSQGGQTQPLRKPGRPRLRRAG